MLMTQGGTLFIYLSVAELPPLELGIFFLFPCSYLKMFDQGLWHF